MATLSISYSSATINEFTASALLSDTNMATGRAGDTFSNATTLYVDVLFSGVLKTATSLSLNTQIEVWLAGSNGGFASDLAAGCPTVEGAFSPAGGSKSLMQMAAMISVTSTATTSEIQWRFGPISVAALFGGSLPEYFAPVVFQNTGQALATSTATSSYWEYYGVQYTSA